MEHPNCLVLKEKQKSFLQEQEYEAGWGKIDMFSLITGRNLLWFIAAPLTSWFSVSWKDTVKAIIPVFAFFISLG